MIANLYDKLVIEPDMLPFMQSIQGGVFQQHNVRSNIATVARRALKSSNMLPWTATSPELSHPNL